MPKDIDSIGESISKWFPKPPTKRKMMFRKSISSLKSSNSSKGPKSDRETPVLQLTSLIDMFTIILIFLLLNFSTDPNQSPPPMDVNLPTIISEEEIEEKTHVGVNVVAANNYSITLDQTSIIESAEEMPVKTDTFVAPLLEKLRETYEIAIQTAELNQIDPDSIKVIIQADSLTSYNLITQIVNTCTMAGYKKVSVMVLAPKF
ncbi:biopolymer transporter ExbD [candidate division WOR-3 bacterium]|nr:biopolymer transporter ExbD [candidate division WOR-3 bacterium]